MNPAVEAIDGEGVDAAANAEDAPMGGIGLKQEEGMNLRICRLLSITAFVSCFVASAQTLAQNAYITNSASGRLAIVDTQKDEIFSNPFIGEGGLGMAVSPDGSRAFIGYRNFRHVSVWNTGIQNPVPSRREFSRLADIPVGGGPLGLASQDRNKVYVANERTGTLSVITATDAVTYKLTATIGIGREPRGVAVSPDGSKLYVTNTGSDDVSVIATATNTVTATILVGHSPKGVAVTPDGSKLYVVNEGSGSVSAIDTKINTVIPTGARLTGLERPVSFGVFIGPAPAQQRFTGTPGFSNCEGQSIAALDRQFRGRNAAAGALGFPDVQALENAVQAFCR